jgi:hypothetical protein
MTPSRKSRKKHPGRPDDAIALAAFRNFAIDVERLLVRIYVTHPEKYEEMVDRMRHVLRDLYVAGTSAELRKAVRDAKGPDRKTLSDENCPPGYELCSDGLCAEVCDVYDAAGFRKT